MRAPTGKGGGHSHSGSHLQGRLTALRLPENARGPWEGRGLAGGSCDTGCGRGKEGEEFPHTRWRRRRTWRGGRHKPLPPTVPAPEVPRTPTARVAAPGRLGHARASPRTRPASRRGRAGGGAARMNEAGGCWRATPGRAASAGAATGTSLPLAAPCPGRRARRRVSGRPQPTVPSAGVTHWRRSASALAAPTQNPPARRPPARAAPPAARRRPPAGARPRPARRDALLRITARY